MKQNLQKRRLTTISQDLRCLFTLFILTTACSSVTLPSIALTPEDHQTIRDLVNKGNALLNAQRYKEALDEYEAVLRIDPGNHYGKANRVLAHNKWALSLFRAHKYKEARQHWETAHELNPNDPTVNGNLKVLEFHLKKLGIEEEQEAPEEDKGAPATFDPLRESASDWSPFKRPGQSPTNSSQTPRKPVGGAFNVGGGIPPSQPAQGAAPQQQASGDPFTQSGPQLIGGVSGSPPAARSGPVVLSGGASSGPPSSGPVMLNGSASSGPAIVSAPTNTSEPGAVANYGGTFTLSAGTSNTDPADDYSAVQIVGGSPAPSQNPSGGHEGLPFTETSSPIPGNNVATNVPANAPANAPAGGYGASTGPSYENPSQAAPSGQPFAGNQGAPAQSTGNPNPYGQNTGNPSSYGQPNTGNPSSYGQPNTNPGSYGQPIASNQNAAARNPVGSSLLTGQQAYGGTAPSFDPQSNVNMSFGTTGNVIIPPPSNRHGSGAAYKFPTNVVPPRAAPGFLGDSSAAPGVSSSVSQPSNTPPDSNASTSSYNSSDSPGPEPATEKPSPPASSSDSSTNTAATVNKLLTEIEKKVYGKTSEHLPILKRLERIEIDTLGKKETGSINDRLNKLKEQYGL